MTAILDIEHLVVILVNLDQTDENRYGNRELLKSCTNAELVDRINREVGIPHWGSSRADYLAHLYMEFCTRDLDCTSFIRENFMRISRPLKLEGKKVVSVL